MRPSKKEDGGNEVEHDPAAVAPMDDDDGLLLPDGGVVIYRGAGTFTTPTADVGELNLTDGGIVLDRRPPLGAPPLRPRVVNASGSVARGLASDHNRSGVTAKNSAAALALDTTKVVTTVKVVEPSDAAIKCISAVLDGLNDRKDVRVVLKEIVNHGLLCFSRLRLGLAVTMSKGADPAEQEPGWAGLRRIFQYWWPVWVSPSDGWKTLPPPGTVGFIANPKRPIYRTKWAFDVNMEAVNDAIQKLEANSDRYFDKDKLPKLITVWRYGAHVRGGIGASVATLLLIATKEDLFCSVLADLAASDRPPQPGKPIPLVVAACHDFETAGLAAPEALVRGVVQLPPDPVVEDAASASPP